MKQKLILGAFIVLITQTNAQSQSWNLTGNAGTDPAINFIGTTDNHALKVKTNNAVRMTFTTSGKVGIGNLSPVFKLDVKGGSITTDSLYRISGVPVVSRNSSNNIQIGDATAKVGIGTSAPANSLDIVGSPANIRAKSSFGNAALFLDKSAASFNDYIVYRTALINGEQAVPEMIISAFITTLPLPML